MSKEIRQFDTDEEYEEWLENVIRPWIKKEIENSEGKHPRHKKVFEKALKRSYTLPREEMNKFFREEE